MTEKILSTRKNGMAVLLLVILAFIAGLALTIYGGIRMDEYGDSPALMVIGIIILCAFWIPIPGLKVLKPQEALVLTLFGKYVGTMDFIL